jgi:hypothetical protein
VISGQVSAGLLKPVPETREAVLRRCAPAELATIQSAPGKSKGQVRPGCIVHSLYAVEVAVNRRLAFYAWADTSEKHPFQRVSAAEAVGQLDPDDVVLDQGDEALTAVEIVAVGDENEPTKLLLHALHGPGSRPSEWGPGEGTRTIQIGEGRYTAFSSHVTIWKDKVAALDMHANSPGLGRLSTYFWKQATERVAFRPLYDQGTAERLKDLDGIRGVDFAIHEPHKIAEARKRGMLRSVLPQRKFPSIHVSAGMSRKQPHDAYIEDELAQELFEIADSAEEFFDRITIRGLSKTEKTKTGKKASVDINLLSERLQLERAIDSDSENPSLPDLAKAFAALMAARQHFDQTGELQAAVEARLALDSRS